MKIRKFRFLTVETNVADGRDRQPTNNLSLKLEIEEIKQKLTNHKKNIELVFNYLDELIDKKEHP